MKNFISKLSSSWALLMGRPVMANIELYVHNKNLYLLNANSEDFKGILLNVSTYHTLVVVNENRALKLLFEESDYALKEKLKTKFGERLDKALEPKVFYKGSDLA
jgi:hypothetical protein